MIHILRKSLQKMLTTVSSTSQLDIDILLQHVLKKDRSFLHAHPEYELTDKEQSELDLYIQRRMQGEPIAYIVGETEFWSLPFQVNQDVLIPRPDTEKLVEWVCEHYKNEKTLKLVDLGTGSGAIAIALAHEFPDWVITASDNSAKALTVAKQNALLNKVNIEFVQTHWLSELAKNYFDIIISNPPYIADADPHLADLKYEPISALTADNNGLAMLKEIIKLAPDYLKEDGVLILEHGFDQQGDAMCLLEESKYTDIAGYCDDAGNKRFVVARTTREAVGRD